MVARMKLKDKRLTKKEKFDIATMIHFIPGKKPRIYPNDKKKMAHLSSRGVLLGKETKGLHYIKCGKTFRDEQITSYKRDIPLGLFTKAELLESMPPRFRDWLWSKIEHVPYDTDSYEIVKDDNSGEYKVVFTGKGVGAALLRWYRIDNEKSGR